MQPQRIVLVTGASRGLGREIARRLADEGAGLILTARGADALDAAAGELAQRTAVLALAGDVADAAFAARLVRAGLDRFGRIDVLVNNASTVGPSPMPALADYPLDAFAAVLRTNLVAPLHLPPPPAAPPPARPARYAGARQRRDPERHVGRGPRGLRRLGRLRHEQG